MVRKPKFSASFSGTDNLFKLEMREHTINAIVLFRGDKEENIWIHKAILNHYNLLPQVLAA